MIKNRLATALAAAACGCGGTHLPPGYQGVVEYDTAQVAFEEAGRIERVSVKRGDLVKGGDELAALDDSLERLQREAQASTAQAASAQLALVKAGSRREDIAAAAAQAHGARANEALARSEADRDQKLFADGAATKAELDRSTTALASAVAQREALDEKLAALEKGARPQEIAEAEAESSRPAAALKLEDARLERFVVRAPGGGEVLDVQAKTGELAAYGTPAATIADIDHPYADVFVPQQQIAGIAPGARAVVHVDSPAVPFAGVVESVGRETEFTPRYTFSEEDRSALVIRVRVRITDPQHALHAGIPAFVEVGGRR